MNHKSAQSALEYRCRGQAQYRTYSTQLKSNKVWRQNKKEEFIIAMDRWDLGGGAHRNRFRGGWEREKEIERIREAAEAESVPEAVFVRHDLSPR